jgi:formiminotetrahydrofolate cyclodeaminase
VPEAQVPEPPAELPSLSLFVDRLAAVPHRASAGVAAGLATALAVDVVTQVAERSERWDERLGVLAQADVLRDRATARARDVSTIYHRLVDALDVAVARSGPALASIELRDQLADSCEILLDLAETACDTAALALTAAGSGDTVVAADATAAAILAAAAAEMTAHLVGVNLLASAEQDLTIRARQLASEAAASRDAALAIAR